MLIGLVVACCGQVLADDKVTYSSDVHPTQIYSLKSFYDIDGDGILEVVGNNYSTVLISKINGNLLKRDYGYGNLIILNNGNHVYILSENKVGRSAPLLDYPSLKQLAFNTYSCLDNNGSNSFTFLGAPNRNDSTFTIRKQQADGTLIESKISYTSDVSQLKSIAISNCPPSGLNNPSSLGDGMFVRAKENNWVDWEEESTMAKGARSIANDDDDEKIKTEDLNGDGLVDFVLGKYIYYNLGNDKFFLSPHVGTIYPADFNGDGLLDYIDFGNGNVDLYLTQTDGKLAEKKTIFTNKAMQNSFFGDFDKDGDVDILLFIPTSDATYTVFFRNDGNGVFKKKESYIDGKYTSFECKDYDADGLYEILVSNAETSKDYLLKCNKNFTTDLVELPEGLNKILADFNHDGITEINSGASYTPLANAKKNTRPEKMSKPIAVLQPEDGKLKITWKQGKDAQTSSCDLTYELRIGTAPGKGDVLFGHALADGTRRNLMDGSMGRSLKYLFDASYLTEGKYYIAVQAVDAGNMGGEWSDEFVYEHQQVAVPTIMPIPSTYCTADTIALRVQNGRKDATYTWNIPHGKVISASDNNDNVNVVFDKAGELSVGVQMVYNGHIYISQNVSFLLAPAKKPILNLPDIKDLFLDMDQDGNVEIKNGYLDFVFALPDRYGGSCALLMDKNFDCKIVNISQSYYKGDQYDEHTWLPLTRNAYPAGLLSNIKNEAPKAPQYVSAQQTEEGLLLKWADAEDDHTPAVQMRYNVSVKRKNKKVGEENAFLISPLNGLSDEAAICSNVAYRKATQMLIPKAALTNGETLEVQVQSIDLMGEHSPMTKPVEVTINNDGYIKVKDSYVTASLGTVVSFVGIKGTSYSIDGGEGATIKKDYGNGEYLVAWNTPGTKKVTITVDGKAYSTNIIAHDFADLTLDFPAKVLRNTPITVKVPKGFSQYSPIDYGFKAADNYVVNYEKGDSTATFTFKNSGEAKVCTFCKFDNSELSKENNVNVIDASMPAAKISEVIGDGTNYRISWQPASNAEIAKVEISRETNRMNQYEVLATVDMNVGTYLDETSDNRIQAHRYRIRYIASNEVQTSAYSTPHNPLHVMINQCGNGYNLMWNAYEGMNVESYTIFRGTSEDSLQPIEYVAGSQQSYTDLTANAGKYYYAVAFTPASGSTYAKSRAARASHGIRSNIISTEEALPATLATSIAINCVESNNSLTNTQQTIHLYGVVLPTYSTYSRVSWSVVRNDDLASISNNGVLTAKGGRGLVTVRATTLDGSNLYVDYDVACNVDKEAVGIVIVEKDGLSTDVKPIIYYDLEGRKIQTPARGHLYITNKGQKIVF